MIEERNKEVVRRWQEAYNDGDYDVLDDVLAPDWVTNGWPEAVPQTIDAAKELGRAGKALLPDMRSVTHTLIAEGDRVVQLYTFVCTHSVEVFGCKSTGNEIQSGSVNVFRVSGGKIVEHLAFTTELDTLLQLGATLEEAWLGLRHRVPE